jgi:hypothetical protein
MFTQTVKDSSDEPGLSAIEDAIAKCQGVVRATALILDNGRIERLMAYAEVADGAASSHLILEQIAGDLPGYAIPEAVVLVDATPLAASGKVDYAALPVPRPSMDPSRSACTELLGEMFAAVLGLESVSMDANFFEVGGHSLLVTRLVRQIRSVMDVEVGVRDLFDAPTIGSLIEKMEARNDLSPTLVRSPRPGNLPVNERQRAIWAVRHNAEPCRGPAMAIRYTGELDHEALRAALADVVARHEALRTGFEERNGLVSQAVQKTGAIQPTMLTVSARQLTDRLTALRGKRPDSDGADPLSVTLLEVSPAEHVLLLVAHPMAMDERSLEIVHRDLGHAYAARVVGRVPVWELLPVEFVDQVLWQKALLEDAKDLQSGSAGQLAAWRESISGLSTEPVLSGNRPHPAHGGKPDGAVPLHVPADTYSLLRNISRQNRTTLKAVLQAGFAVLLHAAFNGGDVILGARYAGRRSAALNDVVGLLANDLVLRLDMSGDPEFGELVTRVRKETLAVDIWRDVPFERIAAALATDSPSHHPIYQAALELRRGREAEPEWPGLNGTEVQLPTYSGLDLAVRLDERLDDRGSPRDLNGVLAYATDVFGRSTAEGLAAALVRVLAAAAADATQTVGALSTVVSKGARE